MSRLVQAYDYFQYGKSVINGTISPLRLANDLIIKPLIYEFSKKVLKANQNEIDVADDIFEGIYSLATLDPMAALSNFTRSYQNYKYYNAIAKGEISKTAKSAIEKQITKGQPDVDKLLKSKNIAQSIIKQAQNEITRPAIITSDQWREKELGKYYSLPQDEQNRIRNQKYKLTEDEKKMQRAIQQESKKEADKKFEQQKNERTQEQFETNLNKRKQKEIVAE